MEQTTPEQRRAIQAHSVLIAETYRAPEPTTFIRLRDGLARFFRVTLTYLKYCLFLVPILILGAILPDVPFRWLDRLPGLGVSELPGNWLAWGDVAMMGLIPMVLLLARIRGAEVASRILGLSWLVLVGLTTLLLIYLSPQLTGADMPATRFVFTFAGSWYVGPIIAVHIYDLTRGGKWWRAPLYGGLIGMAAQVAIYFPGLYAGSDAPWFSWMLIDYAIKAAVIAGFLVLYHALRRRLRPFMGLGGY